MNKLFEKTISSISDYCSRYASTLIPVSLSSASLYIPAAGRSRLDISVHSDKNTLYVRLKPTKIGMLNVEGNTYTYPLSGVKIRDVTLQLGVLCIDLEEDIGDDMREYQINIPQPTEHLHYLTENSVF